MLREYGFGPGSLADVDCLGRRWWVNGGVYRRHFGHHYPAMALLGVSALFDDAAKVELVGVAVIPNR